MSWDHLPRDTAQAATQERLRACRNLSLLLDHYAPWRQVDRSWAVVMDIRERKDRQWQNGTSTGGAAIGHWLRTANDTPDYRTIITGDMLLIYKQGNSFHVRERFDPALLAGHAARWERCVASYGQRWLGTLETATRLIVGLGAATVLETSIALHRLHGYPYISGTALKGLTRSVALCDLANGLGVPFLPLDAFWARKPPGGGPQQPTPLNRLESILQAKSVSDCREDLEAIKHDPAVPAGAAVRDYDPHSLAGHAKVVRFREVFGSLGCAGGVVFFDALPVSLPTLVADIMNPHYAQYYQGRAAPHDGDQRLLPITFLAVEAGNAFRFGLAARRRTPDSRDNLTQAVRWLRDGLRGEGIGAKTSVGYGLFR